MKQLGIMGIRVKGRDKHAPEVQEVLTRHGEIITTRTGFHGDGGDQGLISLTLQGDVHEFMQLEKDLTGINGVEVQFLKF